MRRRKQRRRTEIDSLVSEGWSVEHSGGGYTTLRKRRSLW